MRTSGSAERAGSPAVRGTIRRRLLVDDAHGANGFGIRVAASVPREKPPSTCYDQVGGTFLGATVGLSPDHGGALEGARMEPDHRLAQEETVENLDSAFLAEFITATLAPSYLMRDVGVTWTPPAGVPRLAVDGALA